MNLINKMKKIWSMISMVLSFITTNIILFILFYAVITPFGILKKVLSKDSLINDFKKTKESYWIRKEVLHDLNCHEKQF